MEKLKQLVDGGKVQIAKLDDHNKPQTVPYSQVADEVKRQNKNINISKSLESLNWDEKYEWVNIKRLKGRQYYQNGEYDDAIQTYMESLIGVDLNDTTQDRLFQMKNDLQYPITLNIAVCLFKKKEYKKAIHLCDKILQQDKKYLPAVYKKVFLLMQTGDYQQAKSLLHQGIKISRETFQDQHLHNFIQLNGQLMKSLNKNKNMYAKMFNQDRESQDSTSAESQESKLIRKKSSNSDKKQLDQILYYEDEPNSICGKIARMFKSAIGYIIPSWGTQKHKIKKVLHQAKSF